MTPARVAVVAFTLLLAAMLAIGMWGQGGAARLSDDDYISIAVSDPQVFHPSGPSSGKRIITTGVEHTSSSVIVNVTSDDTRFRVFIDPRTNKVTQVVRQ